MKKPKCVRYLLGQVEPEFLSQKLIPANQRVDIYDRNSRMNLGMALLGVVGAIVGIRVGLGHMNSGAALNCIGLTAVAGYGVYRQAQWSRSMQRQIWKTQAQAESQHNVSLRLGGRWSLYTSHKKRVAATVASFVLPLTIYAGIFHWASHRHAHTTVATTHP